MPYTAAQIVTQATQTAKVPSWTAQAGQLMNMVLNELCTDYDLAVNRKTFNFTFNSSAGVNYGPYTLPTDWLRADKNDVFYTIQGVKYVLIAQTLAQFNAQVQQPGLAQYPEYFAVDNSPIATQGAPVMFIWPPAAGSYPVTAVYFAQMPDITAPESSGTIPWFPLQLYILRRVTGELMLMSGDDRAQMFLGGSTPQGGSTFLGAAAILNRYLKNEGDTQAVKQVTLDRRSFSPSWKDAPNTKTIGW